MKDDQSEEFCKWENFVLNSLINFEPVKRFKNSVARLMNINDWRNPCPSNRVELWKRHTTNYLPQSVGYYHLST
jgi:hypothetical protein